MKNKFLLGCFAFLFGIVGITSAKELNLKKNEKQIKAGIAKVINKTNQIETDRLILRKPHGSLDKKGNLLDKNGKIVFTKDNKIIETSGSTLSGIRKDAEQIFEYAKDPEVAKPTGWQTHKNIIDSYRFIRKILKGYENNDSFILLTTINNKIIGSCGIVHLNNKNSNGELSYAIGKLFWGKGYTPEAINALIKLGLNQMKLNALTASCLPSNISSIRTMEKVGMHFKNKQKYDLKEKGIVEAVTYEIIQ